LFFDFFCALLANILSIDRTLLCIKKVAWFVRFYYQYAGFSKMVNAQTGTSESRVKASLLQEFTGALQVKQNYGFPRVLLKCWRTV
jgi:hypothetical protein